jgi:hypothetical protein
MQVCLTNLMQMILFDMMGYVHMEKVALKIVSDHGNDEFGDFKLIILGMLDTYGYEKTILQIANHLMEQDLHNATRELFKKRSKGQRHRTEACNVCMLPLDSDKSTAVAIFFCDHGFHKRCLADKNTCPICYKSTHKEVAVCLRCEINCY